MVGLISSVNQALPQGALFFRGPRRQQALRWMAATALLLVSASCGGGGSGGRAAGNEIVLRLEGESIYEVVGPEGGPFPATSFSLRLVNVGARAVAWEAESTESWATLSTASGTLQPGATTSMQLFVDGPQANSLPSGIYESLISFRERDLRAGFAGRERGEIVREAAGGGERFIGDIDLTLRVIDNGWTRFVESRDTRKVYVSESAGRDTNDGLTPSTPKRTIAAGKALMRQGHPDWLLLRRGDTWYEAIGQWTLAGRSTAEPILISSYGEAPERPALRTGTSSAIWAMANSGTPPSLNHVAIVGLDFHAHTYTGTGEPAGVSWLVTSRDLLIEDCRIDGYHINVSIPGHGGRKSEIKVRRCVITGAFATSGTVGHGIYLANCDNVLIEENVIDHNGWNPAISGAVPTVFRHGIYVQGGSGTCTAVTVRGNIISNSASHGLQLRPGGVVEDNLFLRNSIALLLGGGNEPNPGGVTVDCLNNVVLDGKDIDANNRRGWGIQIENVNGGSVRGNIVANRSGGTSPMPMEFDGEAGIGIFDLNFESNLVYNWGGTLRVIGNDQQIARVRFFRNSFDNTRTTDQLLYHNSALSVALCRAGGNRFFSMQSNPSSWLRVGTQTMSVQSWAALMGDTTSYGGVDTYVDPDRTISTYDREIGSGGSLDTFLFEARQQSKTNWRPEYSAHAVNSYIREGFYLR
ncbi:MAG: right-handed parallel beta-helix repeat-containing protein [Planctomycetes bacterium]|nr:right-handed parallel beta-helix repeat-containing protein [Planctomycetota bacterium]